MNQLDSFLIVSLLKLWAMISTFENPLSLQTAETDPKVLRVENLLSSSEVIVRFIRREGLPHFGLSILGGREN